MRAHAKKEARRVLLGVVFGEAAGDEGGWRSSELGSELRLSKKVSLRVGGGRALIEE